MKMSKSKQMYAVLKELGISNDPGSMTREEQEALSKNPLIRQKMMEFLSNNDRNLYQELEMESNYVDTHRDISYSNSMVQLHSHNFYEILYCHRSGAFRRRSCKTAAILRL